MNKAELAAYKELVQIKLDAAKESIQNEQEKILDRQDKRIDDIASNNSTSISTFGILLTCFGVLLTVLLVIFSLFGWVSVKNRAREEAQKEVQEWLETKGLNAKVAAFEKNMQEQHETVSLLTKRVAELAKDAEDGIHKKYQDATTKMQEEINRLSELSANESILSELTAKAKPEEVTQVQVESADNKTLNKMDEAARNKPEVDYDFDDWNARAFNAWGNNELENAAFFWRKAAHFTGATNLQSVNSLFNSGVSLARLKRAREAISVFDEMVSIYGQETEVGVREKIALALLNKAELTFKELKDISGALNECDKVVSCYGNDTEEKIRILIGHACNIKGFILLCRAKENWSNEPERLSDLNAAFNLFIQAENEIKNNAYILGNHSYSTFLLGKKEDARSLMTRALQIGGDELHKATLADLDIHPLPHDAEFRTLLNELWDEISTVA